MKKLAFLLLLVCNAVLAQNPFIGTFEAYENDYKLSLKLRVFNKKHEPVDFTLKWETIGWPNTKGKAKCEKEFSFTNFKLYNILKYENKMDELIKVTKENPRIKVKIWLEINDSQYAELESGAINIEQWGDVHFKTLKIGNANLEVTATDVPKFVNDADLTEAFKGSTTMVGNPSFSNWDVSKVAQMNSMFEGCMTFNQPLDKWNISNVKWMNRMFKNAKGFKQDISKWNLANVIEKKDMFLGVNESKIRRMLIDKKDNPLSKKAYDFCYLWMEKYIQTIGDYRGEVKKNILNNSSKEKIQGEIREISRNVYLITNELETKGCKNNLEDKGEKLKEYLTYKRDNLLMYLSDKYYDENISKFDAELEGFKEDIDNYFVAYRISSPDETPGLVKEVSTNTTAKTPEKKRITYVWVSITKMNYPTEMYNIDYAEVDAPEGTSTSVISDAVKKPKIRMGFTNVDGGVYTCESKGCSSIIDNFAKKYKVSAVNCGFYKVQ